MCICSTYFLQFRLEKSGIFFCLESGYPAVNDLRFERSTTEWCGVTTPPCCCGSVGPNEGLSSWWLVIPRQPTTTKVHWYLRICRLLVRWDETKIWLNAHDCKCLSHIMVYCHCEENCKCIFGRKIASIISYDTVLEKTVFSLRFSF